MTAVPARPWGSVEGRGDVWPTPAQDQLLRAALLPDERAIAAWTAIRATVEPATLDGATTALLPQLRRNLAALGVEDELMELFKGVERYTWARTQLLLEPLVPVVAALERADIATMLLKGGALTADGRLPAGLRAFSDLDVLVPTERSADAVTLLGDRGFVPVADVDPEYVVEQVPRYSPSYGFRDEVDRQLDLHWHVLHASRQPGADDDFWGASVEVQLKGVRTRALCATDELLLVISHGLRWAPTPTYRWVVDAAMLIDGTSGPIDYDRLIRQARRRRLTAMLAAGLGYLAEVAEAAVPVEVRRQLGRRRAALLERAELRAHLADPRDRSAAQDRLLAHERHLRGTLPLGKQPLPGRRLRAEAQRLGVSGPRHVRALVSGAGVPGPGRPVAGDGAALGPHTPCPSVTLGVPLDFRRWDVVRSHVAYGGWRAEPGGCWLAGSQARLVFPLPATAPGLLSLDLRALPLLGGGLTRQRLRATANGVVVADLAADGPLELSAVIPAAALAGASELELLLDTPDAATEAALGIGHGDRAMSFLLESITLRTPGPLRLGQRVRFGAGHDDAGHLVSGWYWPEESGRWTRGSLSVIAGQLAGGPAEAQLVIESLPFTGRPGRTQLVDVVAGGRAAASLSYDGSQADNSRVVALRAEDFGPDGELMLELRTRTPRSPLGEGLGDDPRLLGICLAGLTLQPTPDAHS